MWLTADMKLGDNFYNPAQTLNSGQGALYTQLSKQLPVHLQTTFQHSAVQQDCDNPQRYGCPL